MGEKKKIIIDEDWKSQVEAEKEALKEGKQHEGETPPPGATGALPPASFEMLLTSLATEAMLHLGQMPHPATGQPQLDLAHARYTIDLIDVLADKTKGNLTAEEEGTISDILHQLRMAFVAVQSQAAAGPPATE